MTDDFTLANVPSAESLRKVIDELGNQLCRTIAGDFGQRIHVDTADEVAQKLQMLVNFVLHTTQQSADEGLAKSMELDAIFETAADGIVLIDSEGVIRSTNEAVSRIFGYMPEKLLGRSISMIIPEIHADEHDGNIIASFSTDGENPDDSWHEVTATRADGTEFPLELGLTETISSQGRRFTAMVRDITSRRQAEEERDRLNQELVRAVGVKGEFLSTMSHEIRTPINGIMGFADLLAETELDEEQDGYVRSMIKCTKSLLELINDILEFSKIEAGRLELEVIEFDLRSCIDEVAEMLGPRAWEKGLQIAVIFRCGVPRRFKGDPTRVRQILVNLLSNAIKFTEEGEVVIEVDATDVTDAVRPGDHQPHSRIHISVRDTGIGIPEESLHKLFDSFTQADASTTRKYGGTGLGLAICKKIVDVMGGEITVTSRSGEGSTFSFWVELEKCAPAERTEEIRVDIDGWRALIIDDHEASRQVFRETLARWGCASAQAEDGESGMELLRAQGKDERPFDFIILDYLLPGMDGDEILELIRSSAEIPKIPIFMATSRPQPGDRQRLRQIGLDAYLSKPVSAETLASAISRVFAQTPDDSDQPAQLLTQHNLREAKSGGCEVLVICAQPDFLPPAVSALTRFGREVDLARTLEEAQAACETRVYQAIFVQIDEAVAWTQSEDLRPQLALRHNGGVPVIGLGAEPAREPQAAPTQTGFDTVLPSLPTYEQLLELFEL